MKKKIAESLPRPEISTYLDYRKFLTDWFNFQKNEISGYSMRQIAMEAELSSGYLPMVLSGQRSLSNKALQKILPFMKLRMAERKTLELLVQLEEAPSAESRADVMQRLQRSLAFKKNNKKEIEVHKYLSEWYFVAIREMCLLKDFKTDPNWIVDQLQGRITLSQATEALEFLTSNAFITRDSHGKAQSNSSKTLDCQENVYKLSLGEFHRKMLAMAAQSIEKNTSKERSVVGHTLPIQQKHIPKVFSILETALDEIEKLSEAKSGEGEAIYQIELAAFPLTRVHKK